MGKANIYDEEKVLYFASREAGFHMKPDEPRFSDARMLADELEASGLIKVVKSEAGNRWYRTTIHGDIELLNKQISWRSLRGKDVDQHKAKRDQLMLQLQEDRANA